MTDILLPLRTRIASSDFHYVDSTGITRGVYTGAAETTAYGGDRLAATLTIAPSGGPQAAERARRAAMLNMLVSLKGRQNRLWMADHAHKRRGSFPTVELLPNGFFRDTVTWIPINSPNVNAVDDVMRVTLSGASSTVGVQSPSVSVTPYAPYVGRAFLRSGRGVTQPVLVVSDNTVSSTVFGDTLAAAAIVPAASTAFTQLRTSATSVQAGDFFEILYASLARCALVDGAPNGLLRSDTPGGTSWGPTNVTTAVSGTDPVGTTTAFALTETTANGNHLVAQSVVVPAAAADFSFSMYVKKGIRSFCQLIMTEATGGTQLTCSFDVNTGVVGVTQATGVNWANPRYFIEACGGGWFRCTLVGRKTNAAVSIGCFLLINTTDGTGGYVGSTSGVAVSVWRASFAASALPTRAAQTVATAVSAANDAAGYVYLKGLPPSTQGLLLSGDEVQLGKQLCFVTASLDSNEAGLGYLQVSPPLRYSPADNDPLVVLHPMGRFIFSGQYPQWSNLPGVFTTSDVDFEEDCSP